MPQSRCIRKRTGFTLIELLVVIAIIAILAAILFPVFARARENARRASCQSNLKQMGLGIFQYTQDYDEKMPMMFQYEDGTNTSPLYWWIDRLQPYVKSYQIFVCPSHTITSSSGSYTYNRALPGYTYPADYPKTLNFSYATNAVSNPPSGAQTAPFGNTGTALAAIEDVATTLMVFDVYGATQEITIWDRTDISATPALCTANPDGGNCLSRRHLEGTNFLFFDGHVKWLKQSQPNLWTSKSD
jgi:prepilin-type N-terminal cleavage/methylation domain-containing protein/prepilin-type processing-associated H-X9-DG protein